MSRRAKGRALVCAPLPPEYDRESGSRRVYHLVEALLEEGWNVAFVCENAPEASRHLWHLRQRGVATYVGFEGPTADLIEAGGFDVAIFAFWYTARRHAPLVRRLSPGTRILVETVDLHFLRNARRILGRRNGEGGLLDADYGSDIVGELNAYARADGVLTVSGKEAELVDDVVGDPGLACAVADCDEMNPSPLPFQERRGILFVGNFRHPPNLDAVRYLCDDILPLLPEGVRREHPLSVVGNGLDGRVREAVSAADQVKLIGWVPSLEPYLHAARVSVVPLRYGAGTKRKLIQALLAKTPVVTTPAGAEGLDVTHDQHLLVAGDGPAFAAELERLLGDATLWARLAGKGRSRMLRLHGRAAARERLVRFIGEVVARPPRVLAEGERAETQQRASSLEALRSVLADKLPRGASVLVVSRGDPEAVRLPHRSALHFPQDPQGGWAGYHPRDSRAAVLHLEQLRPRADYLVFPATSLWWLDYYQGFASHLATRHERVWADESCVVFRLRWDAPEARPPVGAAVWPRTPGSAPRPLRAGEVHPGTRDPTHGVVPGGLV